MRLHQRVAAVLVSLAGIGRMGLQWRDVENRRQQDRQRHPRSRKNIGTRPSRDMPEKRLKDGEAGGQGSARLGSARKAVEKNQGRCGQGDCRRSEETSKDKIVDEGKVLKDKADRRNRSRLQSPRRTDRRPEVHNANSRRAFGTGRVSRVQSRLP